MSVKTKINSVLDSVQDNLPEVAQSLGLVAMTSAVALSTVSDGVERRAILPSQANIIRNLEAEENNPVRREKENESPHQFISFGTFQRTPARAGKH
jgi:hypothetical protein